MYKLCYIYIYILYFKCNYHSKTVFLKFCVISPAIYVPFFLYHSLGGSEWIISAGDYVDKSFTALGSSDPREVRLEL